MISTGWHWRRQNYRQSKKISIVRGFGEEWIGKAQDIFRAVKIFYMIHNFGHKRSYNHTGASQVVLVVKNLPANAGDFRDVGSIPGLGRSSGGGHDNPLQHSCLENPMDRGAWRAVVHSISWRWLKQLSAHAKVAYNVGSVSGVRQSDSTKHIYSLFQILFHVGDYRMLSRVPCAIQ